jgi:hypothetical protein
MTEYEMRDRWACVDCAMWLANGELPDWMDDDQRKEWLATVQWSAGDGDWEVGHSHDDCDHGEFDDDARTECETVTFSKTPCDVCRSHLAGYRLGVHWYKAKEVVR